MLFLYHTLQLIAFNKLCSKYCLLQLLQDLKKEYVKLEKKIERRGKENIGTDEESDDASNSAEEA